VRGSTKQYNDGKLIMNAQMF